MVSAADFKKEYKNKVNNIIHSNQRSQNTITEKNTDMTHGAGCVQYTTLWGISTNMTVSVA